MLRFVPTAFGSLLARLTAQKMRQATDLVADARKHAKAILKIGAQADHDRQAGSCHSAEPSTRPLRRTRPGAQRRNRSGCEASGGPARRTAGPASSADPGIALARDVVEAPHPMPDRVQM